MKAFFIANVNVRDAEKFQQYAKAAGESMQAFEGKVLTKGQKDKSLAGELNHKNVAVVAFPDIEKLNAWYNSDAYQNLIPLRDEAADMMLTSFTQPS